MSFDNERKKGEFKIFFLRFRIDKCEWRIMYALFKYYACRFRGVMALKRASFVSLSILCSSFPEDEQSVCLKRQDQIVSF